MITISEIVAKTEAMFDLLNEHFYQNELIRPAITVSPDGGHGGFGWNHSTGAASTKSGRAAVKPTARSTSPPNISIAPSARWPRPCFMRWPTFTT